MSSSMRERTREVPGRGLYRSSKGGTKPFAAPVGVVQQRAGDELVRGRGDCLWQVLGELAAGGRRDRQVVGGWLVGHEPEPRRRRMAALSSLRVSTSS